MSATPGCLPGTSNKDTVLLDAEAAATKGMDTLPRVSSTGGTHYAASTSRPNLVMATLMVISLAIGICGLVLGAWATAEVQNLKDNPTASAETPPLLRNTGAGLPGGAVLLTSPNQVPSGYSLVMNIFRGSGYWAPRPPTLFARSDFGAASYKGAAYLFGGLSTDAATNQPRVLTDFVMYDPVANQTLELPPMPRPLMRFGFAVVGDKLYVFGGFSIVNDFTPASGTMVYDFTQGVWQDLPATLQVPRGDLCGAAVDGKVYAIGGGGFDAAPDGSTIEAFDPATGAWTKLASTLGVSRVDCGAVASGGQVYVMGGSSFFQPPGVNCASEDFWKCYNFTKAVERFNPADGSVTRLTDMRYARGDFGIVETSPGTVLVAGGETSDAAFNVTRLLASPWVEEYSVAHDYFTPKAPLPESRFRFAMAMAGDQALVFGGHATCADLTSPGNEDACKSTGLRTVFAFLDLTLPPSFLAVPSNSL